MCLRGLHLRAVCSYYYFRGSVYIMEENRENSKTEYPILDKINSPADLKRLSENELEPLCAEIRSFLVENVTKTGGHLASNLGVVELTVAMHRVFNAPCDSIIWDVGHQSYIHKILTGRKDRFDTLRCPGGLSGFTRRDESEYDSFGAGHSSTSLSAAIGIARAKAMKGDNSYTIAVLGDGAFTGGIVHEALNNCDKSLKLIVVLNENEMSISKNIGRFALHLQRVRLSSGYHRTKRFTKSILYKIPLIGKPIFRVMKRTKQAIKNAMYHSNYFEDLGLYYLGPVDGHNISALERMLREAMMSEQSSIVHVKTVKGKGYAPAEADPGRYHGISPNNAEPIHGFSANMGEHLCEMAADDGRIVAITAAMADGCGLTEFAKKYPDRFFDVGIAEEHALVFAAGLAAGGMHPFFAVYSTFLQRGFDNIIHDIALQKLPVTVCIDRASLSERDGQTHHGIFDAAFLSEIPDITVFAPFDYLSLCECMDKSAKSPIPTFIRYPGCAENGRLRARFSHGKFGVRSDFEIGEKIDALIVTFGKITDEAVKCADSLANSEKKIKTGIIILEQLKPLDDAADYIIRALNGADIPTVFLEEGIYNGSVSMILSDIIGSHSEKSGKKTRILAIKDSFAPSEAGKTLYESCKISARDCEAAINELLDAK